MSAATALTENACGRLGVMVRTPEELFIYWETGQAPPLTIRVADLSGRPAAQSLDGLGYRDIPGQAGPSSVYVRNLLPGHLYFVELGEQAGGGFRGLIGAGPVQTPWLPVADAAVFPAPYSRS
ncbi:MAG TPA: hypothetical protein VGK74_28765 [Symbiobacteriaceae bacterium]|jgi:hypothetical protein